jgi:outer membrane lipoprotein LolB
MSEESGAALRCVDQWALQGRVAFRSPEQSGSARLSWQQRGGRYQLSVDGPLGVGGVRIEGDDAQVQVDSHGERHVYTAAPETVLAATLGYELPVRALRYWVLGLSDPQGGRAVWGVVPGTAVPTLRQAGWTVRYESREARVAEVPLPTRLNLDRGDLSLRLLVEHWDLDPARLCPAPMP